jgi:hypothetical protein
MSTVTPVIGKGSGTVVLAAAASGAGVAGATLPQAGVNLTVEVAAIAAAALVVWGLSYAAIRGYKRGQ